MHLPSLAILFRPILVGMALPFLVLFSGAAAQSQTDDQPNIVVLFADDLGYGDLSCYGHPTIRTPHLDQMAREGLRLTSFYAAAPSCTPSRVALLTGRYPMRAGLPRVLGPDSDDGISPSERTLAEELKAAGYRTAAIGKWHLGHSRPEYLPTWNGFDSYFGLLYSNDMIPPWVQTEKPLRLWRNARALKDPVDQSTLTTRYTEEALTFIQKPAESPFFLYLAYSMPHVPLNTPARFKNRSEAGLYGDIIETIDWSAGQILEALKSQNLDGNTIVVFTSDNGPWLNMPPRMFSGGTVKPWHAGSPGHLRDGKHSTYEGGMRVPAIVRWPGKVPGNRSSSQMATTMDLYPTLLAAAGIRPPRDRTIDGVNLMAFLQERENSPRNVFYYFRHEDLQAVREGHWKLKRNGSGNGNETAELYHLSIDPSERYDLSESHPRIVRRLQKMIKEFQTSVRKP